MLKNIRNKQRYPRTLSQRHEGEQKKEKRGRGNGREGGRKKGRKEGGKERRKFFDEKRKYRYFLLCGILYFLITDHH